MGPPAGIIIPIKYFPNHKEEVTAQGQLYNVILGETKEVWRWPVEILWAMPILLSSGLAG